MRFLYLFVIGLCLAGCQAPSLNQFKVNTLTHEQPVPLNVSDILVVSTDMNFDRMPHIENTLPVTPEQALLQWANHRFQAVDETSPVHVVLTIKQADMTQTEEKSANWYTFDNITYRLSYQVEIVFMRQQDIVYQYAVDGWESSSLPQRSSIADKEETWMKMVNAMIRKVNQQIMQSIPPRYSGA